MEDVTKMKNNIVGKIVNLSRKLYIKRIPILPKLLWVVNRIIFACDIPYTADIHPTVTFSHNGLGVVINGKSSIGEKSVILQNVTIGGNMGEKRLYNGKEIAEPVIGNNVFIGVGASILGPVIIGNNAQIGAGAVVLNDVPPNGLAVGVPAKIVRITDK